MRIFDHQNTEPKYIRIPNNLKTAMNENKKQLNECNERISIKLLHIVTNPEFSHLFFQFCCELCSFNLFASTHYANDFNLTDRLSSNYETMQTVN